MNMSIFASETREEEEVENELPFSLKFQLSTDRLLYTTVCA